MRNRKSLLTLIKNTSILILLCSIGNGNIAAQEPETTPLFECRKFEHEPVGKSASDNEAQIFYAMENSVIKAIHLPTGNLHWISEFGGDLASELIYRNGTIYFVTAESKDSKGRKSLHAISSLTGLTIWQVPINSPAVLGPNDRYFLDLIGDKVCLVGSDGEINVFEKGDGRFLNTLSIESEVSTCTFSTNGKIYLGARNKRILQYSIDTNRILNSSDGAGIMTAILSGKSDQLVVGDQSGMLMKLDLAKNRILWKLRLGAGVREILEGPSSLFVTSNDNFIYSISATNGNRLWRKKLAGRNSLALYTNGSSNLLFSATLNSEILTITDIRSGRTSNQIFLHEGLFLLSAPVFVGDYVTVLTNTGVIVYRLKSCDEHEKTAD